MSGESNSESVRKLVLPGDLMETKSKPGRGIFRKDGRIHASVVGHSSDKSGYINVNGIKGRYNPKTGDKIVAVCAETGPQYGVWILELPLTQHFTTVNQDGKYHSEILQDFCL